MIITENDQLASALEAVARLRSSQGASRYRVHAYVQAADALRLLEEPVSTLLHREGLAGLEALSGVGETLAHVIRDGVQHGPASLVERMRSENDPIAVLSSVPGIGTQTAWKLHEELGVDTLQQLEAAAYDGRLARMAGVGRKRLECIRDVLALRLGHVLNSPFAPVPA